MLGRRFFAYLIDLLVVLGLTLLLGFAIVILGFLTLGLAWWLFAILGPGTAILYSALTVGGPSQATYGMRALGLRVVDAGTGGPVDLLTAAVHALLFYVAAGTFVLLVLDVLSAPSGPTGGSATTFSSACCWCGEPERAASRKAVPSPSHIPNRRSSRYNAGIMPFARGAP